MNQVTDIVINSSKELLAEAIKVIPAIITALIVIMLTRYAADFAKKAADKVGRKVLESKSLQLLLNKIAHNATWVIGIIIVCVIVFPGLSFGDIIATLGLSTVAIGFAFQDIFKNFLAGILILIQRPFHIDDQIIIGNYEGTVERIDIRTTLLRTYDGEMILLPNSEVFTSAVRVRTAFKQRRTDIEVGISYDASLPQARDILLQTIAQVEGVVADIPPEIDIVSFDDSCINFVVRYWTSSRQPQVRQIQTKAMIAIKKALDAANISIAYPVRTVYLYNQEVDNHNNYLPAQTEINSLKEI
ncbi:hypothetical protein NIES4102_30880 [Chondrocystis sp. NIES-4102]|nr:hypothetical protein NIES4102_30880 [Chondrocystis sp. NIES-4102]